MDSLLQWVLDEPELQREVFVHELARHVTRFGAERMERMRTFVLLVAALSAVPVVACSSDGDSSGGTPYMTGYVAASSQTSVTVSRVVSGATCDEIVRFGIDSTTKVVGFGVRPIPVGTRVSVYVDEPIIDTCPGQAMSSRIVVLGFGG